MCLHFALQPADSDLSSERLLLMYSEMYCRTSPDKANEPGRPGGPGIPGGPGGPAVTETEPEEKADSYYVEEDVWTL